MVTHLVLMKPRPDLAEADRVAFVNAFKEAARAIPDIRSVRIGRRIRHGAGYELAVADAADYLAAIDFDDVAGLQAYLRHPMHDEIARSFDTALSAALVYDFEVGGLELLDELQP